MTWMPAAWTASTSAWSIVVHSCHRVVAQEARTTATGSITRERQQGAQPELRAEPGKPRGDPVVEAVDGIPGGEGTAVQRGQERGVVGHGQRLDLDPHVPVADQLQRRRKRRDRLAVRQQPGRRLGEGQGVERLSAGEFRVVMHDDAAVGGGVDVQLDPVHVPRGRLPEGGR